MPDPHEVAGIKHPSNQLSDGEAHNFIDAMRLVIWQCEYEMHPDDDEETKKCLQEFKANAEKARDLYFEEYEQFKISMSKVLRDRGHDDFADCLESGDYSSLAI